MKDNEIVEAIKEMMNNWEKLTIAARNAFPGASEEEITDLVSRAMNKSLGL